MGAGSQPDPELSAEIEARESGDRFQLRGVHDARPRGVQVTASVDDAPAHGPGRLSGAAPDAGDAAGDAGPGPRPDAADVGGAAWRAAADRLVPPRGRIMRLRRSRVALVGRAAPREREDRLRPRLRRLIPGEVR